MSAPSEYIQITIYPEGRVDLAEFASSLLALNAEYRDWLRQHPEYDHNDKDLRLFVDKVSEGSIEVWLTQCADSLVDGPLGDFATAYFKEIIGTLIVAGGAAILKKRAYL